MTRRCAEREAAAGPEAPDYATWAVRYFDAIWSAARVRAAGNASEAVALMRRIHGEQGGSGPGCTSYHTDRRGVHFTVEDPSFRDEYDRRRRAGADRSAAWGATCAAGFTPRLKVALVPWSRIVARLRSEQISLF